MYIGTIIVRDADSLEKTAQHRLSLCLATIRAPVVKDKALTLVFIAMLKLHHGMEDGNERGE